MNEELLKYMDDSGIKWDKSKSSRDINYKLEKEYIDFLDYYGGYCGVINDKHYVYFYSASEIMENNDVEVGYAFIQELPGYLLLGSIDDEALVTNGKEYYLVPFIGITDQSECIKIAEGFENLVENLINKDSLLY